MKTTNKPWKEVTPWIGVAVLWTAAFMLSCRLSSHATEAVHTGSGSVATAVFGEARHALARRFYDTADQYFHRGVPHLQKRAFNRGFFLRLQHAASPEEHLHLEGRDVKEMLPWLWMTLRMDPQNVESFRVTAYWLASMDNNMDVAQQVLREAQQNNPYNYQIKLDQGRLYLRDGQTAQATRCFDAALRFLPRTEGVDPEEVKLETAEIMLYRAMLYEVQGAPDQAAEMLSHLLQLFPERQSIRERMQALRSGDPPKTAARDMLENMLRSRKEHDCGRDHAEEHDQTEDCEALDHTDCTHAAHDA